VTETATKTATATSTVTTTATQTATNLPVFANPAAIDLLSAGNYVILAQTGIDTTGTTAIVGNLGLSPAAASYLSGFSQMPGISAGTVYSTSSYVTGNLYAADYTGGSTTAELSTAISDMGTAYSASGAQAANVNELGGGNIGGLTLGRGVYKWTTDVTIPSNLTLTGTATDVWIFDTTKQINLSAATTIVLSGGALAKNVFWRADMTTTLETTSEFEGIILCFTDIELRTGAAINGRLYSQTAVNLQASTVTQKP
jgi:hypothetical protein